MLRHGASHGLSYLICTVLAGLIVYLLQRFVPRAISGLNDVSAVMAAWLGLDFLSADEVSVLLLAAVLAVVWGMVFKLRFVG